MKGRSTLIRSGTSDPVKQEVRRLLMAHCAIRALMAKAAREKGTGPDKSSFLTAAGTVKRETPHIPAFPPLSGNC
jgi:hypothetical protein